MDGIKHGQRPNQPLDRNMIARAALGLMDEIGIDALTTRRLAARLGVKGPALYWYFKSKDDLLTAMSEHILLSAFMPMDEGTDWREWLLAMVLQVRASALGLRDGARLIATAQWETSSTSDLLERYIRPLIDDGLPRERALRLIASLNSFCLGWILNEERTTHREFLESVFSIDNGFQRVSPFHHPWRGDVAA